MSLNIILSKITGSAARCCCYIVFFSPSDLKEKKINDYKSSPGKKHFILTLIAWLYPQRKPIVRFFLYLCKSGKKNWGNIQTQENPIPCNNHFTKANLTCLLIPPKTEKNYKLYKRFCIMEWRPTSFVTSWRASPGAGCTRLISDVTFRWAGNKNHGNIENKGWIEMRSDYVNYGLSHITMVIVIWGTITIYFFSFLLGAEVE